MKKIIEFIKKNYIIFTIIIAILLVIIGSLLLIKLINNKVNKLDVQVKKDHFYEYIETDKKSFEGKLHYENKALVLLEASNIHLYENSIIYYQDKMRIILPKQMAIVFYYRNNLSYRLTKYSELAKEGGSHVVYVGDKKIVANDFFLFDGEDIYFFTKNTTLKINNEQYDIGEYSFVEARKDEIFIYNYAGDEATVIKNVLSASAKVDDVYLDLLNDATVYNNRTTILDNKVENMPLYNKKED